MEIVRDTNHNDCRRVDQSEHNQRRLLTCVREADLSGVRQCLEHGEDIDSVDDEGNTGLHLAVDGDHYNIAVLLLNKGCSLGVKNKQDLTPLQLAARYNENRSVYSIAIQLTKRTRDEKVSIHQ